VILLLDIGNSSVKWRLAGRSGRLSGDTLLPPLERAPDAIWVSSVASPEREQALAREAMQQWQRDPWFARSEASACGLTNSYAQPQRMGVDRWLAMIAAYVRVKGAVCVVDAGSALTIDFVDADGQHLGGYIIPGLDLMAQSLASGTARVRVSGPGQGELLPGRSTEAAVSNGLYLAHAGAVALAGERYGHNSSFVFTGGGGEELMRVLGLGGDYVADLVLEGLALRGRLAGPDGPGASA
jgi:type III pantothenate kinase